jgi:chemotaxis protein methyltransferase CheR
MNDASAHSHSVSEASLPGLSVQEFRDFSRLAEEELGIRMPEVKLPMVQSRLLRRLRDLNLRSFAEYRDYLFNKGPGSVERQQFLDALTTNQTEFFRERVHFDFLRNDLAKRHPLGTFRAWSAGCASGEEPYSLAITLADHALSAPGFNFQVLASDVSMHMLCFAREAIYPESRIVPLVMTQRKRHLTRGRGSMAGLVRICPELRAKVRLFHMNFMEDSYPVGGPCDVIFFRNVMIYFNKATQRGVLEKVCACLAPGGLLFTGLTESLLGINLPLQPLAPGVYRLER